MDIRIYKDKREASKSAFDIFQDRYYQGHEVFGLATGSTPLIFYEYIRNSDLDFSSKISINLDEYYGLGPEDKQSYHHYMNEQLFKFKPFQTSFLPNGLNQNVEQELNRYDEIIENHPIELQLLGIGVNGHIGFNEPGSSFNATTRLVDLTAETINSNQRFFNSPEDVPTKAYSMGIKSIMSANEIILMAFGSEKSTAVRKMIKGPVTEGHPASVLQLHPNVLVLLDTESSSQL